MAGRKIGEAFLSVRPEVDKGFTSDMQRQGGRAGSSFGSSFTGSVLRYTAKIGAGIALLGGVSKAVGFVKSSVIDFNSQLQNSTIAFTTMLGSGQKAQVFLGQLQQFAKTTPFEFGDLVRNAQNMMGMGIAAKDVIPDLRALGDSVASIGGGAQQVNSVTLAFDQMAAKGTLDMGNMNQILQNGVPSALKVLAASYGVTTGQMIKMISTGKVQSSEALPKLIKGLEQGTKSTAALGGMMDKQSQTFSGAMSNIKDSLTQTLAGAFRPFFGLVSKGAQGLATALSSPAISKFGERAAGGMSKAFSAVGSFIGLAKKFVTSIDWSPVIRLVQTLWHVITDDLVPGIRDLVVSYAPQIKAVLGAAFTAVWAAVKALSPVLSAVGAAIKAFLGFIADNKATVAAFVGIIGAYVLALKAWQLWGKIVTAVQLAMNLAMSANPVGLIVVGIAALVAALVFVATKTRFFQTVWGAVWGGIKTAFHAVLGFLKGDLSGLVLLILGPIGAVAYVALHWKTLWDGIKTGFHATVGFLRGLLATLVGWILGFFGSIIHGAANAFGWVPGIGGKLKSAAKAFDKFKNDVTRSLRGIPDETVHVYVKEVDQFSKGTGNKIRAGALAGIRFRAAGGPIPPFGWSWVGESGPELIRAGASGATVLSHQQSMGGGGGVAFHFHNSVIASQRQAEDMVQAAYEKLVRTRRIRPA